MTCKVIKEAQPEACESAQEALHKGLEAPLLSAYAFEVSNIDPVHGMKLYPIDQAISKAVEKIGYSIEENLKQRLMTLPK